MDSKAVEKQLAELKSLARTIAHFGGTIEQARELAKKVLLGLEDSK